VPARSSATVPQLPHEAHFPDHCPAGRSQLVQMNDLLTLPMPRP
jgi:hypothetical protein